MSAPQNASASCGWPRRLLGRLGWAMGASVQRLDKSTALVLARRAAPSQNWTYSDAVLVNDVWLVVMEQSASAYIAEVNAYTGDVRLLASSGQRGRSVHRRRTRRTVLTSCSGWRGDAIVSGSRYYAVLCGRG